MAVHRRGLTTAQEPQPSKSLGRLIVTIDDLSALIGILAAEEKIGVDQVSMEFVGGAIDVPEDLRKLTDRELDDLTVNSPNAQVKLSSNDAICTGSQAVVDQVYQSWSRGRMTATRTWYWPSAIMAITIAVVAVALIFSVITLFSVRSSGGLKISQIMWPTLGILACTFALFYGPYTKSRPAAFAKIVPLTLAEYRRNQTEGRRQLVTWLIAVCALLVAAVGVLITLLIKK